MSEALSKPLCWSREQLSQCELGRTAVLCLSFHLDALRKVLPQAVFLDAEAIPAAESLLAAADGPLTNLATLVVAGGGQLLDWGKLWRKEHRPECRLIAVPTLWGSGAECSPVAIRNTVAGKEIHTGGDLLPDVRVLWPELGATVPPLQAKYACGDAWSHALEAFVSPLASKEQRAELAVLMTRMLALPLGYAPEWFEASAEACRLQAASSVGLVHGFAHSLEAPLSKEYPKSGWGHAKLCSIFLLPVLRFNLQHSPKFTNYAAEFPLDAGAVIEVARRLFDAAAYAEAMTIVPALWMTIARDRCSRTNHVLVRTNAVEFFKEFKDE